MIIIIIIIIIIIMIYSQHIHMKRCGSSSSTKLLTTRIYNNQEKLQVL